MLIGNNIIEDHAKRTPGISHIPEGLIFKTHAIIQRSIKKKEKEPEKINIFILNGIALNTANIIAKNIPHKK